MVPHFEGALMYVAQSNDKTPSLLLLFSIYYVLLPLLIPPARYYYCHEYDDLVCWLSYS